MATPLGTQLDRREFVPAEQWGKQTSWNAGYAKNVPAQQTYGQTLGTTTQTSPYRVNNVAVTQNQYEKLRLIDTLAQQGVLQPEEANSMITETMFAQPDPYQRLIGQIQSGYMGGQGPGQGLANDYMKDQIAIEVPDEPSNEGYGGGVAGWGRKGISDFNTWMRQSLPGLNKATDWAQNLF